MGKIDINRKNFQNFMRMSYGFGNYESPYWFVGIEPGVGIKLEGEELQKHIKRRIKDWNGGRELEEIDRYHEKIKEDHWFHENPTLQKTWAKLIRVLLSAEGENPSIERIREYQRKLLARDDLACLIELLPLPSPGRSKWKEIYGCDRSWYECCWGLIRANHIRERIEQYSPKVVVFYGSGYRKFWKLIARGNFDRPKERIEVDMKRANYKVSIRRSRDRRTIFVIMPHPLYVKNICLHETGQLIQRLLANSTVP